MTRQSRGRTGLFAAFIVLALAMLLSYGAVWTRALQGDDFCMGYEANAYGFWGSVYNWLNHHNGRLFLALLQTGMYSLDGFSNPAHAPWYLYQGTILLAYLATAWLLMKILLDAKLPLGAAFVGVLPFAIHPVLSQVPMWLAAGYGYITGALFLFIAVLSYLRYERGGHPVWSAVATITAVAATASIEQFLPVLAGLVLLQTIHAKSTGGARRPWLPWMILGLCLVEFIGFHFILFPGTMHKLAHVAGEGGSAIQVVRQLAWWLNPLPFSSPYVSRFDLGLELLRSSWILAAGCVVAMLGAAWVTGRRGSWHETDGIRIGSRIPWLSILGTILILAPLVPFFFTGHNGMRPRNLYVSLMGVAVLGAVGLSKLVLWASVNSALQRLLRWILAGCVATFVGLGIVTNLGAQRYFARSWALHTGVMASIERGRAEIQQVGALVVEGIPPPPYDEIAHMDTGWDFTCLVRWMLNDDQIQGWTNLTPTVAVPAFEGTPYRIFWPDDADSERSVLPGSQERK